MNPEVENFVPVFPAVAIRPGGLFHRQMQMIENQPVVSMLKDMLAKAGSIAQSGFNKPGGRGSVCCTHSHGKSGVFRVRE